MKRRLTALYRRIDTDVGKSRPAGIGNNGGGTTTKIYHMQRALPNLEIINDIVVALPAQKRMLLPKMLVSSLLGLKLGMGERV